MGRVLVDGFGLHSLYDCCIITITCGGAKIPKSLFEYSDSIVSHVVGQEPDVAFPALVQAERQAAIDNDIGLLRQLWAEDAQIEDGRGTSETTDDYHWQGRQAIFDRYRVAVFPNPPAPHDRTPTLQVIVDGNRATTIDTQNGDQWEFVFVEGRWWLVVLRYGVSPP